MVMEVRRGESNVKLLVPPAYYVRFGLRMQMGVVTAVRKGSPAEQAGVIARDEATRVRGDVLSKIALVDAAGKVVAEFKDIDPVRLPYDLAQKAASFPGPGKPQVVLSVLRPNQQNHKDVEEKALPPVPWDDSWASNEERPIRPSSPMSISEIGLAYLVDSTVVDVAKGSPAEAAGVQPHDRIELIQFRKTEKQGGGWTPFVEMKSKRLDSPEAFDQWAHYFYGLQMIDLPEVQVKISRNGALLPDPIALTAVPDLTWPMADRGIMFRSASSVKRADNPVEALGFGVHKTLSFIKVIYLNIKNILNGRISHKLVGSPIKIAEQAFAAAQDFYTLVLFLGIISVNLAVVNFLPIPVLDGGHMVFLIYEKVRGKALPEAVRAPATYVGVAMLLSLMLFVFYQDIMQMEWVQKLIGH